MYVAEHITVSVRAGQTVNAGQQIATLYAGYPWSETGWAAGPGPEALAMADGHWCHTCPDVGDWSTIEGRNMNALLVRVGAPSGLFQPISQPEHAPGLADLAADSAGRDRSGDAHDVVAGDVTGPATCETCPSGSPSGGYTAVSIVRCSRRRNPRRATPPSQNDKG